MNLYIFVIIVLLTILFNIQTNIFKQIDTKKTYTLGIIDNNENIDFISKNLANNKIKIKKYGNSNDLLEDLNQNIIDLGINSEDNFIDSSLGLNNFENNKLTNIEFVTGLYFNYYYFLTSKFVNSDSIEITTINDLKSFYSVYKRYLIIGTLDKNSDSYIGLIVLLYMYGFNPVNLEKKEKHKVYPNNTVFYVSHNIETLKTLFINNYIDSIFLINIYNYTPIRNIIDKKDIIFLDVTFNNTIFNDIYQSYYYKKNITISNLEEDLDSTYTFETKSSRLLLLSNNNCDSDIVYELMKFYYENNNKIINSLTNSNKNDNHNIFEPLDMVYINKYSSIHKGSLKYMKELGFIINDNVKNQLEINKNENFKYYWKYDKIGINKFSFNE